MTEVVAVYAGCEVAAVTIELVQKQAITRRGSLLTWSYLMIVSTMSTISTISTIAIITMVDSVAIAKTITVSISISKIAVGVD